MRSRLSFDFAPRGRGLRRQPEEMTRVLVLADLSGETPRVGLDSAQVTRVDVNDFELWVQRIRPQLSITPGRTLAFESMADFHPDRLCDKVGSIAPSAASAEPEDDAATIERLLGAKPVSPPPPQPARQRSVIDQMVHELVAPHIVRNGTPVETRASAPSPAAIGDAVRGVLHAPAFQRLEAAWRGLRWLVFENPLGHALEVHMLDTSRAELIADIRACAGALERSNLYRLVMGSQGGPDAAPYSLVIGDFSFAGSEEDVSLLAALGAVSAQAHGCFLAAAEPALWGCRELSREPERGFWSNPQGELAARAALLRGSTVAPFIGLCAPRVLGRVPYGERSDPIERFDFTELAPDPAHEHFLWINPAYACAQLILAGVAERGWDEGPGSVLDLGDLPHAMYRAHGGDAVKPCAEVYLDEASAEHLLGCGLMPLLSYRNRNAIQLARLQSIASPAAPLALHGATR